MSEIKRQHPLVIFSRISFVIRELLIPILFVILIQGHTFELVFFDVNILFFLTVVALLITAHSVLHWHFYRYSYHEGTLNIYYGVIVKKHRQIKRERVQTVTVKAGLLLRLFGLVSLSIETAGGTFEPEFRIAALTSDEAEYLKKALKKSLDRSIDEQSSSCESDHTAPMFKVPFKRLLSAGINSTETFAIFAFLSVLYAEITTFIPQETIRSLSEALMEFFMTVDVVFLITSGVIGVFILSLILSVVKFIVAYAFFSVSRIGDEIIIKRGLLEKKRVEIKLHRVQAVTLVESVLSQLFGFCKIQINVVADTSNRQTYSPIIHPFIRNGEVQDFLDKILPGYFIYRDLKKLPKRSLTLYLLRVIIPFLLAGPALFFIPYSHLGLIILPFLLLITFLRYRDAGYLIADGFLTLRYRFISRTTAIVSKNHIQSIEVRAGYLQNLKRLRTLSVNVLSSPFPAVFRITDLSAESSDSIWHWLLRKGNKAGHPPAQPGASPVATEWA